jgi:hypothetical protein
MSRGLIKEGFYMNDKDSPQQTRPRHWWGTLAGKVTAVIAVLASIATIIAAGPVVISFFKHDPVPVISEFQRTPQLALEFWEGGKDTQYPMTDDDKTDSDVVRVKATAAPFEIRFPTLDSDSGKGMHICAWTDDSIFNVVMGTDFSDISNENAKAFESYFTPGKGISNTQAGNAILPVTNKYNSYWVGKRVEHISDAKDRIFISKANDQLLSERKDPLYLSIWIDKDDDNSIDLSEYEYIVIDFS